MSKTVDQRVVSMQFDNKNFEQRAAQSMSTLDKLKQKLNLSGAAKGLNEVNAAAKKLNFSEIENAAYKSGFHIQDIWLKTASVLEYQVAGKIINAGKRILSELTTAPVGDGWKEYEMTLNAVQTTMAGTGKTAEEVEKELKKLDEYADKTIYSTADMLNNLPKFTNADVPLEDATTAMIGIANATALAGGDAGKASIAFYNLGQAIGTGYLTRMDYNSINNAGIATMQWKEAMVEAAIAQGTLTKVGENSYSAGKKTLTLQQLFIEGLQEQWATTDVMMKVFGDYGDAETAIGKKAYAAAQNVKTFTMMMESLKATAGTGWKETWQIVFGGLDEATKFWTGLTNAISKIITGLAEWRNRLLEGALGSPIAKMAEHMKTVTDVATGASDAMKDLGDTVNRVINGDFGNGQGRWDKLTEAGYDWAKVQNLVNEKLGDSTRHQEQANEAAQEAVEATQELNEAKLEELGLTKDEIEVYEKLQEISKRTGIPLEEINGRLLLIEAFQNIGKNLIDIFRELKNAWTETFDPIRPAQLLNIIDKFHQFTESIRFNHDQVYKLWKTFHGLFAIIDIISTIVGGAFRIAFTIAKEILAYFNLDILDVTAAIADVIIKFRDWFKSVINIKGVVAAVIPIIEKIVGALRNWIKSIKESEAFNKFTTSISKMTKAIKEWFAGMKNAENVPQYIAEGIGTAIGHVLKFIRDMIQNLGKLVTGGFSDIGGFITEGFLGGLGSGIKSIGSAMIEFGKTIINKVCKILGIESPSTVFITIGGFVAMGFAIGFENMFGTVWDIIKNLVGAVVSWFKNDDSGLNNATNNAGSNTSSSFATGLKNGLTFVWEGLTKFAYGVIDFIKNVPFSKIFAAAGSAALIAFAYSISKATISLAGILDGVSDTLQAFSRSITRIGKAVANSLNAMAFKQFAISIAILVGAIVVLATMAKEEGMVGKLWIAVGIVAALAGIMAGLFLAITKLNSPKGVDSKNVIVNMTSLTFALLAIAGAIFIIAFAAKMIGSMSPEEMKTASTGLIGLVAVLVGLMAATKLMAKSISTSKTVGGSEKVTTDAVNVGKTLIQMAGALLVLVIAAKLISKMDWDEMAKAGIGLTFLAGIMVGLMAATKLLAKTKAGSINAGLQSAGKMLLQIAGSIIILVFAAKIIAGMSWDEMAKAGAGLLVLAGLMVGLIAATQLIAKTAKGNISTGLEHTGKMLLEIALAIGILALASKIIAGMSWEEMGKAAVGITALSGIIVGLIAATRLAGGNDLKGVGATLMGMALVIGVMAATAVVLSLIDLGGLAKGVIAMALLGAVVAGMVAATKNAKNVKGTMIGIAIAIGVMAASIALLSFIDPASLASATAALSMVMGMFALVVSQAGKAKKAMLAMITMAGVIAIIGGVLILLANCTEANEALAAATAISLVLAAMAVALKVAGVIKAKDLKNALFGVAGLLLMMVPLMALIAILHFMPDVSGGLKAMPGIISALTALSIMLVVTAGVGAIYTATGGMALLGIVGLLAMMIPLMALIAIIRFMPDVSAGLPSMQKIVDMMGIMTVMLVALAIVGPLARIGVSALNALIKTMVVVGLLAAAVGAVADKVGPLIDKGIPLLIKLAEGLGRVIGNFVSGIFVGLSDGLPAIAENLKTFSDILSGVDLDAISAGVEAGKMIADMASAIPNQGGIVSWFAGDNSLAAFAPQIVKFGKAMASFSNEVQNINPEAVRAAAEAGKIIAEMASIIPNEGGVASWFAGDNSLAAFSPDIVKFGKAMAEFSAQVAGVNPEAVTAAASAGKTIAEMASIIPNQGGVTSWFAGDNSLAAFGPQIVSFGQAMAEFSALVANVSVDTVRAAADAGKVLVDMTNSIPNSGGVVSWFAGDNSLAAFAPQIVSFGEAIASFSDTVATISLVNVTTAVEAGKALVDMTNTIPVTGGVKSWFSGDNSLASFAPQIISFGNAMAGFSNAVKGISVEAVRAAADAGKAIADMANTVSSGNVSNLGSIGKEFGEFAEELVTAVEALTISIDFQAVTNLLTNMDSALSKVTSVAQSSVSFSTGAETIVATFANTIISKAGEAIKAVENMLDSLVTTIKGYSSQFSSAGGSVVEGFAAGITAQTWRAEAKAEAMAQAALQAAKNALNINSPSKVFREVGKSVPEGFAMGIGMLGGMVKGSVEDMASGALNGTKSAIARISDVVNSDIDTQPTIRPVLDLSDIRSGANSISGMFGINPSVGLMTNVGAISSMMNSRQNVGNGDIISALRDLENSLSGRTGDTYIINGITYDDGSNVSEAVKSLVRAARRERRV